VWGHPSDEDALQNKELERFPSFYPTQLHRKMLEVGDLSAAVRGIGRDEAGGFCIQLIQQKHEEGAFLAAER
jgi:hypothetical protein